MGDARGRKRAAEAPSKASKKAKDAGAKGKRGKKRKQMKTFGVKKPKSAYIFFTTSLRQRLKKSGREMPKAHEIAKMCGTEWRAMSATQKKPYDELAARDKQRYIEEISKFRKKADPDKPKRPQTAYFYFLAEFRKAMKAKGVVEGKKLTSLSGEKWRAMSTADKAKYEAMVTKDKERYQREMDAYRKKKGIKDGEASSKPVKVKHVEEEEEEEEEDDDEEEDDEEDDDDEDDDE